MICSECGIVLVEECGVRGAFCGPCCTKAARTVVLNQLFGPSPVVTKAKAYKVQAVLRNGKNPFLRENKKTIRQRGNFKKYGLTPADFREMRTAQSEVCKICKKVNGRKELAVDHCHKTGKVRGLLCTNCNMGIGYFKDNPELLRLAADYLSHRP